VRCSITAARHRWCAQWPAGRELVGIAGPVPIGVGLGKLGREPSFVHPAGPAETTPTQRAHNPPATRVERRCLRSVNDVIAIWALVAATAFLLWLTILR
jgi:hypothetical protein